jgi:hypothetical protein
VVDHWRGQLSLPVSLFVSGGGSYAIIMGLAALAAISKTLSLIYPVVLLYLVSLIWLLFGVVRSAFTSNCQPSRALGWTIAVTLPLAIVYTLPHDFWRLAHH